MDFFNYKDSALFAEEVSINEIASQVSTPFYCYSSNTLLRHYNIFKQALGELDPLICYAVKANN
ncbi:MAG: diaminopimelate decarboxylase, partial [Pseudomonadota bacterium]